MVLSDVSRTKPNSAKAKIDESEIILRRILKTSPQDLWLDTIRRAHDDKHNTLIYWMLNQTECDFAIAAHAFYRADPTKYLDEPMPLPSRPGPSDIFAFILLNWDIGSYRTHQLAVEEKDAPSRLVARVNQKVMVRPRSSLPFNIPERFLRPEGGRRMQLPPYQSPENARHLWPIYAKLGLDVPAAAPGFKRKLAQAKTLFARLTRRERKAP